MQESLEAYLALILQMAVICTLFSLASSLENCLFIIDYRITFIFDHILRLFLHLLLLIDKLSFQRSCCRLLAIFGYF